MAEPTRPTQHSPAPEPVKEKEVKKEEEKKDPVREAVEKAAELHQKAVVEDGEKKRKEVEGASEK